jgi:prephenate dehydratase
MRSRPCIAFQGELGAFGHTAVSLVDADAYPVPMPTFEGVITAVREGVASLGVLPIENVIVGPVNASIAALTAARDTVLIDEVTVPVRLCLLALRGASIDALREVHSQDIALAQCGSFLAKHPHLMARHAHDTAGAAKHVARSRRPQMAAIAGNRAAEHYGLEVLVTGIEDRSGNATRFAVFALRPGS